MQSASQIQELEYENPEKFLAAWPESNPLVYFATNYKYVIIALKLEPVSFAHFLKVKINAKTANSPHNITLPFAGGFLGLASYDDFSGQNKKRPLTSQVYFCSRTLVFMRENKKLFLCKQEPPQKLNLKDPILDIEFSTAKKFLTSPWISSNKREEEKIVFSPKQSNTEFSLNCKHAKEIADTKRIRQISLLRYFNIESAISFFTLKQKFSSNSCIFHLPDFSLFSFKTEDYLSFSGEKSSDIKIATPPREIFSLSKFSSFKKLFSSFLPAGHIDGKRETLAAVNEIEGRDRGFFMGSAFFYDPISLNFSSSILLETIFSSLTRGTEFASPKCITQASEEHNEEELPVASLPLTA